MCLFRVHFVFSCVFIKLAIDRARRQKFSPVVDVTERHKDIAKELMRTWVASVGLATVSLGPCL